MHYAPLGRTWRRAEEMEEIAGCVDLPAIPGHHLSRLRSFTPETSKPVFPIWLKQVMR